MNIESTPAEFERRAASLLRDSAERLPASVRSRLTQARHAAIAAQGRRSFGFNQRWLPAGAAATAVAVLMLVGVPHGGNVTAPSIPVAAEANSPLEDIELIADSEVAANPDQAGPESDYDFYEWAADEASGAAAAAETPSAVGS